MHFVRTAEAACKLPWKKEVYVIRISQSHLFNSCRSSLVPYSHLTVLLWKEYCSCQHCSTGLQDYSGKKKKKKKKSE